MRDLDASVEPHLEMHVVLDNLSAHKAPLVHRWLVRHPRVHFHFTPTYTSWLNLVETLFGKMARTFLRGMRVASWEELRERILKGITEINALPVVHRWRKFEALQVPL